MDLSSASFSSRKLFVSKRLECLALIRAGLIPGGISAFPFILGDISFIKLVSRVILARTDLAANPLVSSLNDLVVKEEVWPASSVLFLMVPITLPVASSISSTLKWI